MSMEPYDEDEEERLEDLSTDDLIVALHLRTHQLAALLRPRGPKKNPPRNPAPPSASEPTPP